MPRFDRGVVNTKLEKGDIVLMGNPTQYGEILAENILVEDILKADLETLISGSNLVRGKFYRITNAVSSTLSLLVQGLTANTICDYAYNTANGDLVTYNISTDLAGVPFSSVYVPYTGATADVNLGEYQIRVGQLELDQTPTGTFGVSKIRWNDTDGTPEVMLKGGNVTLQIGQEQLARVVNKTNTNLTEAGYQVVRISGAQGQRLKVGLAQANSTSTCKDTLGLVTENISNNAEGFITTSGIVRGINTTGSLQGETWADGDRLYLSPSVAGGITNVEPSAPNIVIVLGYVVYAHANQGSIYISVEGAKALHELFDVSIPTPTNNNVLVYESSTGLWKDKSISTILGFTPIANNATVGGELSGTLPNPSLVTSAVTGKALTGLSVSGSAVVSTDSILTGIGKLQNQINAVVGSVNFQGVWNASTNSPSLASGVGTKGYYYIVSVAGSTNLDGITDWKLGDWAIYDGTAWQKVDNTDAVVSVNGYTGIVTLAAADVGALPTSAISGTTGKLPKFTASGAIGDSIVSESGGKIGLNVTPTRNLHLLGGVDGGVLVQENASTTSIPANGLSLTTGFNVSYLSSRSTGVVGGVADLAYSAKSHIFDDGSTVKMSLSATELITFNATDTGEAHIFGGSARVNGNTLIRGNATIGGSGNPSITIEGTDPAYSSILELKSAGSGQSYIGGTNILNLVTGSTERLTITSSGNVGIGTTSPTYKLEVNAGALDYLNARFYGSENAYVLVESTTTARQALVAYKSPTRVWAAGLQTNGNYIIGDDTAAATRFVIDTSGNVGIGTTSPSQKLDVNGNIALSFDGESLIVNDQRGTDSISIRGAANINFHTFNGSTMVEAMRIASSRNVLIGTTIDDTVNKLQVSGSGYFAGSLRLAGTEPLLYLVRNANTLSNAVIYKTSTIDDWFVGSNPLGANDSDYNIYSYGTSSIVFKLAKSTGAATFSSSVSASNVLVGTTTASYPLFVVSSGAGVNTQIQNSNSYAHLRLQSGGTNQNAYFTLNCTGTGVGVFQLNDTDRMSIKPNTINISSLPTSASGLSAGDLWNNGGVVSIV